MLNKMKSILLINEQKWGNNETNISQDLYFKSRFLICLVVNFYGKQIFWAHTTEHSYKLMRNS